MVVSAVGWEWACDLDEKYLFAVYSGCIPLVHGYKIYDRLECLGFDTFRDIIDTSSQYEKNPILSIWNLLDSNLDFFKKAKNIIARPDIQARLQHNWRLSRNVKALYQNSKNNLNTPNGRALLKKYKLQIWDHFSDTHLRYPDYE